MKPRIQLRSMELPAVYAGWILLVLAWSATTTMGQENGPSSDASTDVKTNEDVPDVDVPDVGMPGEDAPGEDVSGEDRTSHWETMQSIDVPTDIDTPLVDVILGPRVFDNARRDLGDLRLFDASGRAVPYALREMRRRFRREKFEASEFNRGEGPDDSSELVLDLGDEGVEHNEVKVITPGRNFRRRVVLEGSDDGKSWREIADTNLIQFDRDGKTIDGQTIAYPTSRFRYLRVRVFRDPAVDKTSVRIERVEAIRKVEVPGELLTLTGELQPREPVRAGDGPGSAWIIDLGGNNVPCDRIEVDIEDTEFVRNIRIEAGGPEDSPQGFYPLAITSARVWQRRAGERQEPLVATFAEVRAARLRLVVTDYSNPPLTITAVRFSAPARQVVFAGAAAESDPPRLYFGNPDATAPNYDFARNLPKRLDPAPVRATLGNREPNPDYIPPPVPFTERWPWLIYVVLGSVAVVLAAIIASLARKAIARHDRMDETTLQEVNGE